jgi:hypothetical protein
MHRPCRAAPLPCATPLPCAAHRPLCHVLPLPLPCHAALAALPLSHHAFVTHRLCRVALCMSHRHVASPGSGLPHRAFHVHLCHAPPFCHTSALTCRPYPSS